MDETFDETEHGWIPLDLTRTTFPVDPKIFGGWSLDPKDLVLDHAEECYHIDLEQCLSSAEVLDVICQIGHKTWATDEILSGLVRMFNRVLGPQQHLCGCGRSSKIAKKALRAIVEANVARFPGLPIRTDIKG